jgi:uncharacterized protein YecT (DUF1311 family)
MYRSRSYRLFVVALAAVGSWPSARGKEPLWSDCKKLDYESQAKQNACAALRYEAADKELNKQYKITLGRLTKVQRHLLISEQREWLHKLEPQCKETLGPHNGAGNMWPMEYNDCLAQETEARTQVLKRWQRK